MNSARATATTYVEGVTLIQLYERAERHFQDFFGEEGYEITAVEVEPLITNSGKVILWRATIVAHAVGSDE